MLGTIVLEPLASVDITLEKVDGIAEAISLDEEVTRFEEEDTGGLIAGLDDDIIGMEVVVKYGIDGKESWICQVEAVNKGIFIVVAFGTDCITTLSPRYCEGREEDLETQVDARDARFISGFIIAIMKSL